MSGKTGISLALAYQTYEGERQNQRSPLLVIHGMVGSTLNFAEFCKSYSELSGRKVISVDCRNHGQSPLSEHMSYPLMAGDIAETLKQLNISKTIVLGHSMGGKVAMQLALSMPSIVETLIVEDMQPFKSPPGMVSVVISAMVNLDLTQAKNREDVDNMLKKSVSVEGIREYVLNDLYEDEQGIFHWRTNVKSLHENLEALLAGIEADDTLRYSGEVLFIGGETSVPNLRDVDMNEVRKLFPKAELEMVPGASHFVHNDKPKEFQEILNNFLK